MPPISAELRKRTKDFALRIIRMYGSLPGRTDAHILGNQVLRSGTSIGANYRAANRARSRAEFASRMAVVEEEADETVYWLELLVEGGIMPAKRMERLLRESHELAAIFTAARMTAKRPRE